MEFKVSPGFLIKAVIVMTALKALTKTAQRNIIAKDKIVINAGGPKVSAKVLKIESLRMFTAATVVRVFADQTVSRLIKPIDVRNIKSAFIVVKCTNFLLKRNTCVECTSAVIAKKKSFLNTNVTLCL